MKNIFLLSLFCSISIIPAFCQTGNEIVLGYTILQGQNFVGLYKKEFKSTNYLRIGINSLYLNRTQTNPSSTVNTQKITSMGFGLEAGYEKRIVLDDIFSIYIGPGLFYKYDYSDITQFINAQPTVVENITSTYGTSLITGLMASVSERLHFGMEYNPQFSYFRLQVSEQLNSTASSSSRNGFNLTTGASMFRLLVIYSWKRNKS